MSADPLSDVWGDEFDPEITGDTHERIMREWEQWRYEMDAFRWFAATVHWWHRNRLAALVSR